MIERLHQHHMGDVMLMAWVNTLPPNAQVLIENGYDYTAYAAKSDALYACWQLQAADIGIVLDAAYSPVRHFGPLIAHIQEHGYYLGANGFRVGEWSTDRALKYLGVSREAAMGIPDVASGCVGVDFRHTLGRKLANAWAAECNPFTVPGPHSNIAAGPEALALARSGGYRNVGFCSVDPRVAGHRHDQTVLSVVAHLLGCNVRVERPKFCSYSDKITPETIFLNRGL
jgi:hypothetical protein